MSGNVTHWLKASISLSYDSASTLGNTHLSVTPVLWKNVILTRIHGDYTL